MKCPYCGNDMISGKAQNNTMQHMLLAFQKDGEVTRFRDLFRKEEIASSFLAGGETDAYYCENCKKIAIFTDCL